MHYATIHTIRISRSFWFILPFLLLGLALAFVLVVVARANGATAGSLALAGLPGLALILYARFGLFHVRAQLAVDDQRLLFEQPSTLGLGAKRVELAWGDIKSLRHSQNVGGVCTHELAIRANRQRLLLRCADSDESDAMLALVDDLQGRIAARRKAQAGLAFDDIEILPGWQHTWKGWALFVLSIVIVVGMPILLWQTGLPRTKDGTLRWWRLVEYAIAIGATSSYVLHFIKLKRSLQVTG